ncbi:MAG: hypothetical protein MRZ79_25695, partial [Bacteroidia bacterium]|nr:hypothetical protein [Bacteroidia bacterium]
SISWLTWYWPFGQLDRLELLVLLVWIKDKGFGGIEIYPIPSKLPPKSFSLPLASYLEEVLYAAGRMGIQVDVLAGSNGMGIPQQAPDSFKLRHLLYGESHVLGGKLVDIYLPKPKIPSYYHLNGWEIRKKDTPSPFLEGGWDKAKLIATYGIKAKKELRTGYFWDLHDQTFLDPDSVFVLDKLVDSTQNLKWEAPGGYWKIIAIYAAPNGQRSYLPLASTKGELANPFDSSVVEKHLDLIFKSILSPASQKMKSLHGVSYGPLTYQADEFFINDFEEDFAVAGGFQIREWLPALLYQGMNNSLFPYYRINSDAEFVFTEEDKRIRNSYKKFANDRLIHATFEVPSSRLKTRDLYMAIEPYGWDFDVIEASSRADIPVFDQYNSSSSALLQKLVSSGAVLGGKRVIRSRTLGYRSQIRKVSPQEIKIAVDQCFMSGANQILLDGINFYSNEEKSVYQPEPYLRTSPMLREYIDEEFLKELNAYATRMQQLLSLGKQSVDIAIYYPFKGLPSNLTFSSEHKELFFNGNVEELRKKQEVVPLESFVSNLFVKGEDERVNWLRAITPLINELDQQGLNWIWVNDDFLSQASWDGRRISLGATEVELVLLPDVESIDHQAAKKLAQMASRGAKVIAYGKIPSRQNGFYKFEERDAEVKKAMESIVFRSPILDPQELRNLIEGIYIPQNISFDDAYPFLRRIRRNLPDSSEINVFHNIGYKERVFQLDLKVEKFWHYWLDPQNGSIHPAKVRGKNNIQGYINGFSTCVLLSSKSQLQDSLLSPLPPISSNPFEYRYVGKINLEKWDLAINKKGKSTRVIDYRDTSLMNWRGLTELDRLPDEAHYSTKFEIGKLDNKKQFLLELGRINTIADVFVNTNPVKTIFHKPYTVEISPYLEEGLNVIEVWVKRPQLLDDKIKPSSKVPQEPPVGLLGPALIHVIEGKTVSD